jgi:hypothetical protein
MFIRQKTRPFGQPLARNRARAMIAGLYALYPAGCVVCLWPAFSGGSASWLGAGFLLGAGVIFLVLARSDVLRQVHEPAAMLDERERAGRNQAAYRAHAVFSGLVLVGALYMMFTADRTNTAFWSPQTGAHWAAVFGGLLLLSLTLPGAFLAFGKAPPEDN